MANFASINDSDMEKAQVSEYQATCQTRDLPTFSSCLSFLRHRIGLPITQAPILKPLKINFPGLIETRIIRQWLAVSLCSSMEVCKDRIMHLKVASQKQKSELGELEGLLKFNFCDELEGIGFELHYKQPDFVGNLSRSNLVCGFTQKRILENLLFTIDSVEYPAIEPESSNKLLKLAIEVVGDLAFHRVSEEQDMYKDFKLNNNLIDLKVSNMLHDRATKSTCGWNNYATNVDGFTTLNIPSVSEQQGKTNLEIEKTVGCTGAPTAKKLIEMASEWWRNRSYLHKSWPMKVKNESRRNVHILLLIFTLLASVTFHMALKFYVPGCRLQGGYETNSSLDSVFQVENESSYSTRIFIIFNSVAFFISVGMLMILFNELPFRPLLLVLVFSMIGSYMCTLMDPMNPSLCSF